MTMNKFLFLSLVFFPLFCCGQSANQPGEETLIQQILAKPSSGEIRKVRKYLRQMDLSPKEVFTHDSIVLSNGNRLYVLSHLSEGKRHYGAVIIPANSSFEKLPVMIMATGGDGMHTQFNIAQDFNHQVVQFPQFLGQPLDDTFIVVIPSFRGQQLIIGDRKYQSEGKVSDAFDGAATDALGFLNVVLKSYDIADKNRIGIYGGSRGGTVALLAASRDARIKRVIAVAAPTDMKELYQLYPDQFKLLFFNDLLAGEITREEARRKFISISPINFIDALPEVQLHHDKNDPFVPITLATKLVDEMNDRSKEIQPYYYDEGIHGFWTDPDFWRRVQDFMMGLKGE